MRKKRIYKVVYYLINTIAVLLVSLFTWLQFDTSTISLLNTQVGANILFRVTLAIYYLSWVAGSTYDLKDEEYSLKVIPNDDKITPAAVGIIILLAILFGVLCWVDSISKFIISLDIFLIFNVISWRYLVTFLNPTFKQGDELLKGNFNIEYQIILQDYLAGNWQKIRFFYGFFVLMIINIINFTDLKSIISEMLNMEPDSLITIGFFFYVITFSVWIWIKGWNRRLSFKIFDELDEKYNLTEKKSEKVN